ncbi:threonine/serine ThrE exporter family protein [Thermohalobacter berrensis]|uniref:Threonine/serine exporter-like N-terminal domain-containing protein n=1 Tax=Thermohalobacter berrensis TaxID=99594 RepID=A0A419SU97_9FIRM|nr:threonine/serine exporter family protein [Thermohalobacter berrensis]RKD28754.1 hypothetical protein BET03_06860 [Thermohalobacter berrensis]
MTKRNKIKKLVVMAMYAGKIMLKNGAETYRVEDTIIRICKSRNIKYVEAFVTPTGIFLSVEYKNEIFTYVQRIKTIKIDLNKIALVNDFSRKFVGSNMSVEKAMKDLKNIDNANTYKKYIVLFFSGIASGFFTLLFGGSYMDFFASFISGALLVLAVQYLNKLNVTYFLSNLIGGSIVTSISILFSLSGFDFNMDKIIIGAIMPLVPGVAITNAIRDSMSGEFLSGVSRGVEAIIIASAIAFGVGITLKFY